MDAETRKTLEAIAATTEQMGALGLEQPPRDAAAIRAALAEVDALTQQVATLESAQWACHVCGNRIAPGGGSIVIAHDDECRCAATIADLEARVSPTATPSSDRVTLQFDQGDRTDVIQTLDGTVRHMWDDAAGHGHADFPSLAAALSAAREAP